MSRQRHLPEWAGFKLSSECPRLKDWNADLKASVRQAANTPSLEQLLWKTVYADSKMAMIERNGKAAVNRSVEQLSLFDFFRNHKRNEEDIFDQRPRPDGRTSLEGIPPEDGAGVGTNGETGGSPLRSPGTDADLKLNRRQELG